MWLLLHSCQPAKTISRDASVKKWDLWVKSRDIYIIRSIHFIYGHYSQQSVGGTTIEILKS